MHFPGRCILCDYIQASVRAGIRGLNESEWHKDCHRSYFPGAVWTLPHSDRSNANDHQDSNPDRDSDHDAQQYSYADSIPFFH